MVATGFGSGLIDVDRYCFVRPYRWAVGDANQTSVTPGPETGDGKRRDGALGDGIAAFWGSAARSRSDFEKWQATARAMARPTGAVVATDGRRLRFDKADETGW